MVRFVLAVFAAALLVPPSNQQNIIDGVAKLISEGEQQINLEPEDTPILLKEYDFIIVGAGTAGCVLANRLSENPNWTVLLIEAGRPENYLMDMPILAHYLQFTESNWKYRTQPSNDYCVGLDGQRCNYPRGKVVGGSSVLNYMIYTRGNRRDYDHWANLGNDGWSFKDVLPYFKKIEKFDVPEYANSTYHSQNGYLSISYSPYKTKIADAIIAASKQAGIPEVDYNGATQVGVSRIQATLRDGVRESSSRAYLHPIRNRKNLHMKKFAMVTKILIDPTTKQTQGVRFRQYYKEFHIRARKEVVVSAGAINSPQLLMLSGIGPKKHLKEKGIPVLSNLKVGYNLMDHIATGGLTFQISKNYTMTIERIISVNNIKNYLNYHKGPLSVPGGCEVLLFHDFADPNNPDGYPEIELLYQGGSLASDPVLHRALGVQENLFQQVYAPLQSKEAFMVFPMLMRPKSRGRIMLKDNNYKSKPLIYPNYFADPYDMATLVKGVRLILKITQQRALQDIGAKLHSIPIPQCAHYGFESDAYFDCMTRYFTFTIYHQSGTCKMGPASDKKAVVDPRLRVHRIKGLRVIDASIIPEIPAAHTNAPVFMIAEKGADMIKQDWGVPIEQN